MSGIRPYVLEAKYELVKALRLPAFAIPTITFPVFFYVLFGLSFTPPGGRGAMRMATYLLVTFYLTMAAAGYVVEIVFGLLGLVPEERNANVTEASIHLNYTTVLNVVFLLLAASLIARFLRTGGPAMLRMMGNDPPSDSEHHH